MTKLKNRSSLSIDNRPLTIRDKPVKKEKLGLLTKKQRVLITFRWAPEIQEMLGEILEDIKDKVSYTASRTGIIEAAVLHFISLEKSEREKICLEYGRKRNKKMY